MVTAPSGNHGAEMDKPVDGMGLAATCETFVDSCGTPTLKLAGELDIACVGPIGAALDAIIAGRPNKLVVDLSELRFIDSSGLSLFLAAAEQIAEVELRHPSPMFLKVIDLTGLSDVFLITP
jgi:anti-sigma B factor antagonist